MSAVSSYTEFQPLEEVIVGHIDGAMVPSWTVIEDATVPPGSESLDDVRGRPGAAYRPELVDAALRCLDEFLDILRSAVEEDNK